MNSGQRTARRLAARSDSVCNSCLARLSLGSAASQIRTAATAAAVAPTSPAASTTPAADASGPPAPQQAYQLRAGVVLSRAPILTRSLHPFEKAFFLYQRRLNERLALPFTRYFYYKKGTPADREWKRKAKQRLTPARDIGVYNAYSETGWNDELLVGDRTSEPEEQVEALIRDAEGGEVKEGEQRKETGQEIAVQRPLPRATEADQKGDQTSLNRQLDKGLYLLIKNKAGQWKFPEDLIQGKEGLHQAAERVIVQAGGINMNTWVVGNAPIGHYSSNFPKAITNSSRNAEEVGEKVFFMKARILAGQADVSNNTFGNSEFKWLSKEEIQKVVTPKYWSSIKNMLAER
ncbi:39S mitochondrial ribosomal protein L46-domain-containing protein [Delphinella strobiligena]|nr:39S mitochondrial ribosomal protein L46-domain-containing protein [Delphinella strobiligena]